MKSLTLSSPAKINLYLKVIRRRPDGYHELLTLFHRIALSDSLRLKKNKNGFVLKCSDKNLSVGENNLVTKAYRALQQRFPQLGGASVYLKKNIPMGAGLGGGSSNAATMLLGMKKLYDLKITLAELVKIGKQLGADVPFFLYEINHAIGKGRGDDIQSLSMKTKLWFVLLVSNEGLQTKSVYHQLPRKFRPASLTKEIRTVKLISTLFREKKFNLIASLLQNDLEKPAFKLRPSLKKDIASLVTSRVVTARMTGSGPTLFAILAHPKEAKSLAQQLRQDQPSKRIFVTHSL
jgi:4-diphosphocytidyl-2-C-methyl-D-erythritol kinase